MKRLEIIENYTNVNWEEVIPVLMAFAESQISIYNWSRCKKGPLPLGKESYDLAIETILNYLEDPHKFNPERNKDLIKYLKYSILRRLVSNLSKLKENADTLDNEKSTKAFATLLANSPLLHEKIDIDKAVLLIQKKIEDDSILSNMFICLYDFSYTRKETYEELKLSPQDYDNHVRRLRNIITKILKDYINGRKQKRAV